MEGIIGAGMCVSKSDLRPGVVIWHIRSGIMGVVVGEKGTRKLGCIDECIKVKTTPILGKGKPRFRIWNMNNVDVPLS